MLILSRKVGERIIIGEGEDKVIIEVEDMHKNSVRLRIIHADGTTIRKEGIQLFVKANCDLCKKKINDGNHGTTTFQYTLCSKCVQKVSN